MLHLLYLFALPFSTNLRRLTEYQNVFTEHQFASIAFIDASDLLKITDNSNDDAKHLLIDKIRQNLCSVPMLSFRQSLLRSPINWNMACNNNTVNNRNLRWRRDSNCQKVSSSLIGSSLDRARVPFRNISVVYGSPSNIIGSSRLSILCELRLGSKNRSSGRQP